MADVRNPENQELPRRQAFSEIDALEVMQRMRQEGYRVDDSVVTPERLAVGMTVELEHGRRFAAYGLDVTDGTDDPMIFAKIAYAHFMENPGVDDRGYRYPDYYYWLKQQEDRAEDFYREYETNRVYRPKPIRLPLPPPPPVRYGEMYD